jgi:NADH-quinone oxidoreductase subunit G
MSDNTEYVTLSIDGKEVTVPKGTNLIDAAASSGIDIPYYCYHPHLSVAGNCRMCQVEVEGRPKLEIGCNTQAQEGMVVKTQHTSEKTKEAQRSTLEFLLINHPLDCTICDQAGHCKLQDYYYEYNSTPSRFIEDKVTQVKAEVLGENVVYDGERCIVCTRCVRFCDEYTETGELGVYNRGDRSVIGIVPGKELDNPFSACVVDLCPVGALTHRKWRFNTRIWNTKEENTICTGCSTACNAKVAVRDGEFVQVKARLNSDVNQEWMCDEGRYGFDRFQPKHRLSEALVRKGDYLEEENLQQALVEAASLSNNIPSEEKAVVISPFLTLEEMWTALSFAEKLMGLTVSSSQIAVQLRQRELSELEAKLISPDYAPNARAATVFGIGINEPDWRSELQSRYQSVLSQIREGKIKNLLLVGDFAILDEDLDQDLISALLNVETSVALTPRGVVDRSEDDSLTSLGAHQLCKVILPSRTVHEKSGVMLNSELRFQRLNKLLEAPFGSFPEWMLLKRIAEHAKKPILDASIQDDRGVFRALVKQYDALRGLSLMRIGELGLSWDELLEIQASESSSQETASV